MLNYDDMYEELEKTQKLLTKEIKKLNEKNDLTPGELSNLKEAVCVMDYIVKIDNAIEASMDGGYGDSEYSEYYGGSGEYMNSSRNNSSYARGRDARTGRYVSRENSSSRRGGSYRGNGSSNMNQGSMRGVSRHSLNDRMAANLEMMMDDAGSDFERQKIGEWIDRIRTAPET